MRGVVQCIFQLHVFKSRSQYNCINIATGYDHLLQLISCFSKDMRPICTFLHIHVPKTIKGIYGISCLSCRAGDTSDIVTYYKDFPDLFHLPFTSFPALCGTISSPPPGNFVLKASLPDMACSLSSVMARAATSECGWFPTAMFQSASPYSSGGTFSAPTTIMRASAAISGIASGRLIPYMVRCITLPPASFHFFISFFQLTID